MNRQEALNVSYMGIVSQGGPSVNETGCCMYRSKEGRKCGIGWLIPDNLYNSILEGFSIDTAEYNVVFSDILGKIEMGGPENLKFLTALQEAHDFAAHKASLAYPKDFVNIFFKEFRNNIENLAQTYGLEVPN